MGVYIKGMEMPKSCYHCVWMFRDKPSRKVYCTATDPSCCDANRWLDLSETLAESRHEDCPLVPAPPHGRLIDADALEPDTEWSERYDEYTSFSKLAIHCAPTIIPSEEGET